MLGGNRTLTWLKKTRSIVILGIERAGKTTLVNQWARGRATKTLTTMGLEVEHFEVGIEHFNIIDLGGQEPFRLKLWQTYAQMASGIIFVFDVTDPDRTAEAIKWFWQVQEWLPSGTHIMFCANKIDLKLDRGGDRPGMDLQEIIISFNLKKFGEDLSKAHSFRIFEISALTGENIVEAMHWMFNKLQRIQNSPDLRKIVIADFNGNVMCDIPFLDEQNLGTDNMEIANIILGNKSILHDNTALELFESDESIKILVTRGKYLCVLSASKQANFHSARVVAETIMSLFTTQIENNTFDEKLFAEVIELNFGIQK